MTFESKGLLIVAIYIWLPPASYVVFLTTLVISFPPFLCKIIGMIKAHMGFWFLFVEMLKNSIVYLIFLSLNTKF